MDGVDIRNHGEFSAEAGSSSYAVAAAGYSSATKPSMLVENVTGDRVKMIIRNTTSVTIRNNVSDTDTTADLADLGTVTFTGNIRITRE